MNSVLIEFIESKIKRNLGISFQELIDEIFLHKYEHSYKPIKPKHDQGCDGIIEDTKTVIACYAPEKYDLNEFKRKIQSDYEAYDKYWKSQYPNWLVVYNDDIRASQQRFIESLYDKGRIIGIKTIIKDIEALGNYKIRSLAKFLKIDAMYISNDVLSQILDDLLKDTETNTKPIVYKRPTYIIDKIKLNYSEEDVNGAISVYEIVSEHFNQLSSLIKGYTDTEINSLKSKIIADFNLHKGNFKERLEQLTVRYGEKYNNDDEYIFFVRVILLYIFEQCLIGKKVTGE